MAEAPSRSSALASPLGAYRTWHLSLDCPTCQTTENLPIANLIAQHGAQYRISVAVDRLTCRTCGKKPVSVDLVAPQPSAQRAPLVRPDEGPDSPTG
jgi:hypothetical protein